MLHVTKTPKALRFVRLNRITVLTITMQVIANSDISIDPVNATPMSWERENIAISGCQLTR